VAACAALCATFCLWGRHGYRVVGAVHCRLSQRVRQSVTTSSYVVQVVCQCGGWCGGYCGYYCGIALYLLESLRVLSSRVWRRVCRVCLCVGWRVSGWVLAYSTLSACLFSCWYLSILFSDCLFFYVLRRYSCYTSPALLWIL